MCHPGDHEESVLPIRTYPGESQGGIVVSDQATTALYIRSSRITWCTPPLMALVFGDRAPVEYKANLVSYFDPVIPQGFGGTKLLLALRGT
jgi:hypothetical protein